MVRRSLSSALLATVLVLLGAVTLPLSSAASSGGGVYDAVFALSANTIIGNGTLYRFAAKEPDSAASSRASESSISVSVVGPFDAGKTHWTNEISGSNLPSGSHYSTVGIGLRTCSIGNRPMTMIDTQGTGSADNDPTTNSFATDTVILRTMVDLGTTILFVARKFNSAVREQISIITDLYEQHRGKHDGVGDLRLLLLINRQDPATMSATHEALKSVFKPSDRLMYTTADGKQRAAPYAARSHAPGSRVRLVHVVAPDKDLVNDEQKKHFDTLNVVKSLLTQSGFISRSRTQTELESDIRTAIERSVKSMTGDRDEERLERLALNHDAEAVVNPFTRPDGCLEMIKGSDNGGGGMIGWLQDWWSGRKQVDELGCLVLKEKFQFTKSGQQRPSVVSPSHIANWRFTYETFTGRTKSGTPKWSLLKIEAPGCTLHDRWDSTLEAGARVAAAASSDRVSCDYGDGAPQYFEKGLAVLRTSFVSGLMQFRRSFQRLGYWYLLFENAHCRTGSGKQLCIPATIDKQLRTFEASTKDEDVPIFAQAHDDDEESGDDDRVQSTVSPQG